MMSRLGGLLGIVLWSAPVCAQAQAVTEPSRVMTSANGVFDLSVSLGVMAARATETVYATRGDGSGLSPGGRISQLNWTTQANAVAGLTLGVNLMPGTRVEASLALPFTRGDNKMIDTDWLSPEFYPQWTDQSQHPNTKTGRTYAADLKLAQDIFATDGWSGAGLIGFRRVEMAWKAYGGRFVYTEANAFDCAAYGSQAATFNPSSNFRNCTGQFDPGLQIAYRQIFDTPYLGLRGRFERGPWTVMLDVIGSPFVLSSDKDLHVGIALFRDRFTQQAMVGATLRAAYRLTETIALFSELDGQWYFNQKGVGDATFNDGTYSNFGANSAGISLQTTRLSLGLQSSF